MERDIKHFRHLLFSCFDSKETATKAHQFISETYSASSVKTCDWFRLFKSDFDLKDKERSSQKNSKMLNCRYYWMKAQLEGLKN